MSTRYDDLHSVLALALLRAQRGVDQLTLSEEDVSSVLVRDETNKGSDTYERSFSVLSSSVAEKSSVSSLMSDADGGIFLPPQLENGGIIPPNESDDIPDSTDCVHPDLLNSGVAVYLGCCDKTRHAGVVLIHCRHPAWTSQYLTIASLTTLLLYYQHLSRKQLTLIVDARDTTREVVRSLLETISALEVHGPSEGTVDIVHILVDRISQALILRSPFFRNSNPVHSSQIDLLTNIDVMYRVVDKVHLPVDLGGRLPPCHLRWVRFRQVYEPLMNRCWEAVHILMRVARHLSESSSVAKSVKEINDLIRRHDNEVENLLRLPSVAALRGEAERKLQRLRDDNIYLCHNSDYRESMEVIENLFAHLLQTLDALSQLSSIRISKLNRCLKVRKFEECYNQVVNSLAMINQEILTKYSMTTAAVSLQSLKLQQEEFNEVQLVAKAELSRGDDLLELGRRMIEAHDPWMVEVIERFCVDLRCRIDDLTQQLNQAKEKLDGMARCSQMLDKSYEWTQNATKFVADVDPPLERLSLADLEKSISDLERCLWEQPMSSLEDFQVLLEDCRRLGTLRLVERCMKVQNQHKEAVELIKIRKEKLHRLREQLQRQQCTHRRPHLGSLTSIHDDDDSLGFLRRRSYAGKPSTPMYSPHVEAFKRKDMDIQEYEEYLFSEGLITDDMSERIVTSLPKGLSDMTMRGSRESLRSSKESLHESQECLLIPAVSQESLNSYSSTCRDPKSSNLSTNKQRGKPWRMIKKAVSFLIDSNTQTSNLYNLTPPGLTLSSESLVFNPKRSEGEPRCQSGIVENGFSWYQHASCSSPLMYRNPNAESIEQRSVSVTKDLHDAKRTRIYSHIMSEMIKTEKDYVGALKFVIVNYLPELNRDDVVQPLRGKRNIVFGNLEKIYEFHSQTFLQELEHCHEAPLRVGDTFLRNASNFYLYALYNKNKPKSDALMKDCGTAFFTRKQRELSEKLDLNSYLLKPVQRMGKYALLLEELIKECPSSVSDYSVLKDALEMVRFQLRHGNDLLAMDCIRHCDVSVQEQGRLLLQDPFSMTQGRRKSERHVFLFEEMILFTKPRRRGSGIDWLDYKTSYKMSDVGLTENVNDERKFEIWFRKRSPDVTFVLEAPSAEVKRLWIGCLTRLLWKQAIRNRQRRRNELSDMGHGWKPGVDLKRSNNYIQDHAICLASHQNMSKVRNSIAVTSFEHCRTGNKRPHSMISVTSSSSSGSSHSSGYPCSLSTTYEMPFENADVKEDAATQTTLRPSDGYLTKQWPCDAEEEEEQITRV